MNAVDFLLSLGRLALVLGAAVIVVAVGRAAARWTRQPEVVGELAAGLLAGPAAMWLLGPHRFHSVLPDHVLADVQLIAQAGLVLFMVGLAHELRLGPARPTAGAIGWVAAGSFVPALVAGGLLAGWVLTGAPQLGGGAPASAFVMTIAVSMSITAVPVLARILSDREMTHTEPGRVAFSAAVVLDAVSWLMLAVAAGLSTGRSDGFLGSFGALAVGVAVAWLLRRALSTRAADGLGERRPGAAALLLGVVAIAMALAMEQAGMTAIFGAVLAGLAVPVGRAVTWTSAVSSVTRVGRKLLPVFFVTSGVTVLTKGLGTAPVTLIVLTTVLGIAGKAVGGYFGARLGGQNRWDSLRVGSLMNTRGLTELIVLQVGFSLGILTRPVFLAFLVMALVTTSLTGPLLRLIDRAETRYRPAQLHRAVYAKAGHAMTKGDVP